MSGAPALHIVLPLEGRPQIYNDCQHEGDELRLADWLASSDEAVELLEIFMRWQEAA